MLIQPLCERGGLVQKSCHGAGVAGLSGKPQERRGLADQIVAAWHIDALPRYHPDSMTPKLEFGSWGERTILYEAGRIAPSAEGKNETAPGHGRSGAVMRRIRPRERYRIRRSKSVLGELRGAMALGRIATAPWFIVCA